MKIVEEDKGEGKSDRAERMGSKKYPEFEIKAP